MTHLAISVVLALSAIGVIAEPQRGKGGKGERGGGPTGLGALLGADARPGVGCAKLEVLIGWSKRIPSTQLTLLSLQPVGHSSQVHLELLLATL
jgi:hypothetical protein